MAQTITKTGIGDIEEIRLYRRFNQDTQEYEYFGATRYLVNTDDPTSDYWRAWDVGPLSGTPLNRVLSLFADVLNAIKNRESIP